MIMNILMMKFIVLCTFFYIASVNCQLQRMELRKSKRTLETLRSNLNSFNNKNTLTGGGSIQRLENYKDSQYYANIGIGSPKQKLTVAFSTITPNLWVPSSQCSPSKTFCEGHYHYNSTRSSTSKLTAKNVDFDYGAMTVEGDLFQDTVLIADFEVENQNFVAATNVFETFNTDAVYRYSGVLGLGPDRWSVEETTTVLQNMVKQKLIANSVFSLYLIRDENIGGGEIVFGGTDEKHYKGEFVDVPITMGMWAISMDHIKLGNAKFCAKGCNALVDPNAAFIVGSKNEIETINKVLGAVEVSKGQYAVDCSKLHKLRPFHLVIGEKTLVLKPTDYVFKVYNDSQIVCMSGFANLEVMQIWETVGIHWILGDVFMGKYYTKFDFPNNRIGFAEAV